MNEYFPQDKLEITTEQQNEFIDAVKRFEPYFATAETPSDITRSAVFDYQKTEVRISAFFEKSESEKIDWAVVVTDEPVVDHSGGAMKTTKNYLVQQNEVSEDVEGEYREDIGYKPKGQEKFKPVKDRIAVALAQMMPLDGEELQEDALEKADEELRQQQELEQMTGEYSEMFSLQRFEDVMGILQGIDPEKDQVEQTR